MLSLGGWTAVKALRGILGDGDFIERVLGASNERLERRATLKAMGYDFERLAEWVAELFEMPPQEVLREGKYARTAPARSVLCYWANREFGITTVELAKRLKIAQSTATKSVASGERIAAEKRFLVTVDMK